jgi:hypothetical protein
MDRPFFLSWGGLWFFLFLVGGHVAGYFLVRSTRRRRLNDFVAIGLACLGLALCGVSDIFLDVWYVHAAGFGLLMGTIMFLASTLGKEA